MEEVFRRKSRRTLAALPVFLAELEKQGFEARSLGPVLGLDPVKHGLLRRRIRDSFAQTLPALFYLAVNAYLAVAGFR